MWTPYVFREERMSETYEEIVEKVDPQAGPTQMGAINKIAGCTPSKHYVSPKFGFRCLSTSNDI